ncbi:MAG TPA: DUF1365 domain-containing protein [Geminicoccaceae bacterium]|nr:DUF1365 domain-containing protein [Geminicoccaceae bacterium]
MKALQRATQPTSAIYLGQVMHRRLTPVRHRFIYRVFSLLLDLDRLAELDRSLRVLSVNRANLVSFFERDHGARDGSPLRPWIDTRLQERGLDPSGGRVFLLCFPRLLGYVFDPLSVYYCYGRSGRLDAIIYEVKNRCGEQHAYVLPVVRVAEPDGAVRQSCAKRFYVSPLIEMAARYRFKLAPPGERLTVVIQEEVEQSTSMVATLTGRRRPLTDGQLLRAVLRLPLMTLKVIVAIHYEALRLWLKGAPLQPSAGAHHGTVGPQEHSPPLS